VGLPTHVIQARKVLLMAGLSAAAKYRRIAKELLKVPSQVSKDAALGIEKMWRRSYMAGTDPYGNEWEANKDSTIKKKGHDWVMVDTEGTLKETRVRPLPGAGISLRTGKNASYHLEATATRPARPVLPLYGMPKAWTAYMKKVYVERAQKAVHSG
jgi:hypothetical protein